MKFAWSITLALLLLMLGVLVWGITTTPSRPSRRALYDLCVADGHKPYDCYHKLYRR